MHRTILLGLAAASLFLVLLGIEVFQGDEPITASSLAADILETGILILAVTATSYFSLEVRDLRADNAEMWAGLARARAEGNHWRRAAREHLDGLAAAIQRQFTEWGLTNAECDIAALMLKGLSHKEIANLRHTSEATVRQQARAIYVKSGLANRAELSAFFLEDLLPPQSSEPVRPTNSVS